MDLPHLTSADVIPDQPLTPEEEALQAKRRRIFRRIAVILITLVILFTIIGFVTARHWLRQTMSDSLPQLDGGISIPGLSAPVTIQRDARGVPHHRAASLDDLLLAQGFVTAQDRLWQMDSLRRHASGTLAEILGPSLLAHDRLQRTLLIRASADRAIATLPPDPTWRDHPPAQPTVDLTAPQKDIPNVPLDESQTQLNIPNKKHS